MTDDERSAPKVLIAIPTYRRPDLLPPLVDAVRDDMAAADAPCRLLIVDNDPERSAAPVAAELDAPYAHQPIPGIAAVRQAALDAAADDELLVMIDDDVLPEEHWLEGLLEAWRAHRPTAVMGFVRYVWPAEADPWVAAGGFMRRTRFPTGTRLDALSTGSALLDVAAVRALGIGFDLSLGLAGGEDLQLGRDILARGGSIVASADSVARSDIPLDRASREFVRRRAISQGQTRVRLLVRDPNPVLQVAKRGLHLAGGLVRLPLFVAAERWAIARGDVPASAVYRRRAWFARGRVLGAVGHITPEYARDPRKKNS